MASETSAKAILMELKKIAPSIAFSVEHTVDRDYEWDGDGPDPREEGFDPYDVDVYATAIVDGDEVEGRASLGGTYDKPDDIDPDIGGYLPQMLQEAAEELASKVSGPLRAEAKAASKYLKDVMRSRYDKEQRSRSA